MKTPREINEEIRIERLNIYFCIRAALRSEHPETMGFKGLESYKTFVERKEQKIEDLLDEHDKQVEKLEKKLGKPAMQITDEEYHAEN
jgi:hypothetical protein